MSRRSVEAERRRQVLRATCEVVAERGFRALRVSDVAERAGLSSGSVHYYFDSKEELLRAAFVYNFEHSLERRSWLVENAEAPVDRLHSIIESYLPADPETVRAWRVWVELWVSALGEEDLRQVNDEVYGKWRDVVVATIRYGQEAGVFRDGDPVLSADVLIGMLDGLAIQVLIGSRHMSLDQMRRTCMTFVDEVILAAPLQPPQRASAQGAGAA